MGHTECHGPKLFLHLSPKDEWPLVEQDVTALTINPGKEHGLDQTLSIIEGGKFHRLITDGMDRLGSREHPRGKHVTTDMLLQLRTRAESKAPKVIGMELHWVRIGHEPQCLVFLPPAP